MHLRIGPTAFMIQLELEVDSVAQLELKCDTGDQAEPLQLSFSISAMKFLYVPSVRVVPVCSAICSAESKNSSFQEFASPSLIYDRTKRILSKSLG